MTTPSQRDRRWLTGAAACAALALALAGCTGQPDAGTTSDPVPAAEWAGSPTPAPAATDDTPASGATPTPGDPCDPAAGDPDCTDATVDETFRHIAGYADCVAEWASAGRDEAHGLCTDLDGDGSAGYADSH
ncbi:hypothetical protein [Cellulomonas hominis]|uniref:hypothetical protein n=1 Tax=Cellulomonas hominis TaxID=156981 RepID=UPI001B9998B2|nr:hypothetical protein [Cellulomonas hominis]VTR76896.1 hypothetical protein CHMI_01664 [Cellulomonas hominis]